MLDGRRFVYAYNCSSPQDDLDAEDAPNLVNDPEYAQVRKAMIRGLGAALESDPP